MNNRYLPRLVGICACVLLILLCAFLFPLIDPASLNARPENTLLGVPIIQAAVPGESADETVDILYNGQPVPLDAQSKTLYISLTASPDNALHEINGLLSIDSIGYSLAFAADPAFSDLKQAIADNHTFTLLAQSHTSCTAYNVVFTPLPVIVLAYDGNSDYSDPYTEHYGSVYVFEPDGSEAKQSYSTWHRRGMTTRLFKKGSWKLSLKNKFGANKNMEIAGLGSDDDWILNAMGLDDLKMRQKTVATFWNQMTEDADPYLPMCAGAYAEVILENEYTGLYLLQRRIDPKYLALEKSQDILLKGSNDSGANSPERGFVIRSSPLSDVDTFAVAERLFDMSDLSGGDVENFVDIICLSAFAGLYDNLRHRNMYYIMTPGKDGYDIYWQLWDNDTSFGHYYSRQTNSGHFSDRLEPRYRREYMGIKELYPDLDIRIADRWHELRKDVFSQENALAIVKSIHRQATESGAFARDRALWGERRGGIDTFETMCQFILNQLELLDEIYAPENYPYTTDDPLRYNYEL